MILVLNPTAASRKVAENPGEFGVITDKTLTMKRE
jgi:hypothetical protein